MSSEPRHRYQAFGLIFDVPFACPALMEAPSGAGAADVYVTEGDVPRSLPEAVVTDGPCDSAPGAFLLRGGRQGGRFLAVGGDVTLHRNPGADDVVLGRLFTDRVMAALLHQRGFLVLHANAAATDRGAIVVSGESGAGKSTTLSALLAAGCSMLSDDVTALRLGADGVPEVLPGVAQLHLTEDAAEALDVDIANALIQPWRRMKAAVHKHVEMADGPRPLLALHRIRCGSGDHVVVERLTGAASFKVLQSCLYGPVFEEEHQLLFPLLRAVVACGLSEIMRPAGSWSVPTVVEAILARSP